MADSETDTPKQGARVSDTNESELPVSGETIMTRCGHKFVRGISNVLTGSGEIPRQMIISYRSDGPVFFIPVGLFTGIFMTAARTAYGGLETATFIAPLEGTYGSLLKPEYVWEPIEVQGQEKKP